jgi:hypothetical protein
MFITELGSMWSGWMLTLIDRMTEELLETLKNTVRSTRAEKNSCSTSL